AELDGARLEGVLAPKGDGGWLLHELTRSAPLDFFVLFSSASALLGPVGQAGYAAANAFLDALAERRRLSGLPALSIHWGRWAGGGMAGAPEQRRRLEGLGVPPLPAERMLAGLEAILGGGEGRAVVLEASWSRLAQLAGGRPSLLSELLAPD